MCLIEALERKWLGGAILDVMEQEPLRNDSPLWTFENVGDFHFVLHIFLYAFFLFSGYHHTAYCWKTTI